MVGKTSDKDFYTLCAVLLHCDHKPDFSLSTQCTYVLVTHKKFKFNGFTIGIGGTCREDAIDVCEYCNDKLPNALRFAKQVSFPKTRIFISWHLNAVCNLFIWRKCTRVFWRGGGSSSRRMEPETL